MQDLEKKPKYLLTITVGLDQRQNVDRMVKKVYINGPFHSFFLSLTHFYFGDTEVLVYIYCDSFLRISNFCFSTMMVGQVNGMNLSGQRV